jgi:HPt (histidine-containing phosphotransfer) domain-containing protein
MTAPSVLDQQTWEDLLSLGGSEADALILELITMYLEDAPLQLAAIREAASQADRRALAFHAHALRSPSASLGALGLAEACASLEVAAAAEVLSLESPLVQEVLGEAERVVQELTSRSREF